MPRAVAKGLADLCVLGAQAHGAQNHKVREAGGDLVTHVYTRRSHQRECCAHNMLYGCCSDAMWCYVTCSAKPGTSSDVESPRKTLSAWATVTTAWRGRGGALCGLLIYIAGALVTSAARYRSHKSVASHQAHTCSSTATSPVTWLRARWRAPTTSSMASKFCVTYRIRESCGDALAKSAAVRSLGVVCVGVGGCACACVRVCLWWWC